LSQGKRRKDFRRGIQRTGSRPGGHEFLLIYNEIEG
jgi:hypothetical protein